MNISSLLNLYGREPYETPATYVVEVKSEGIVCTSNPEGTGSGFIWDLL